MQGKDVIDSQIKHLREKLKICEFLEEMKSWIVEQDSTDKQAYSIQWELWRLISIAERFIVSGDMFNVEECTSKFIKPNSPKWPERQRLMAEYLSSQNNLT